MKNRAKFFRIVTMLLLTAMLLCACAQPQTDTPPQSSQEAPIPEDIVGLVMYADAQQMTIMVHTPSAEIQDYKTLTNITFTNTGNAEIVEIQSGAILQYVQMGGMYPASLSQFTQNTMIAITHDATGNQLFIILDYLAQPKDGRQFFGMVTELSDTELTMTLYVSNAPVTNYIDFSTILFYDTTDTKSIALSQITAYQAVWEEELVLAQKTDLLKNCFVAIDTQADDTLVLTILSFPEGE